MTNISHNSNNNVNKPVSMPAAHIITANNKYSNILPKTAMPKISMPKLTPVMSVTTPSNYLKSALVSTSPDESGCSGGVNRRNKNNISTLTKHLPSPSTSSVTKQQPKEERDTSNNNNNNTAVPKRKRKTIKNIFESSNQALPVEKKFRNSRKMTIDPPDPAILLKLKELETGPLPSQPNKVNRKDDDVHDEIADIFEMNSNKTSQRNNNINNVQLNLDELISKNVSPPKTMPTAIKKEPVVYSDKEEEDGISEETTLSNESTNGDDDLDDHDQASNDSDFDLVLQLNKNLANELQLKPRKTPEPKKIDLSETVRVKIEKVHVETTNRSLRSRVSFKKN